MISLSSALPPLVRSLVQFTVAVYVVGAQPVAAAEELLLHVLSAGAPVSGASVVIDGVTRGRTLKDGSLLVDINGLGAHTLAVETAEGTVNARFTAGTGQLVDAIVEVDQKAVSLDVYSRTEGIKDRKAAAEGTLKILVIQGERPAHEFGHRHGERRWHLHREHGVRGRCGE